MYRLVKDAKYVLLLEYLKLIVNGSCVQKENTKQKEIIHLVDPRTLQNKAAGKQSFEFQNVKRVNCINWEFIFR